MEIENKLPRLLAPFLFNSLTVESRSDCHKLVAFRLHLVTLKMQVCLLRGGALLHVCDEQEVKSISLNHSFTQPLFVVVICRAEKA
jgi:hypothetical protein